MSKYFLIFWLVVCGTARAQLADVDFRQADSVAALYRGKDLSNLPVLAHQLTSPLPTQAAQFRAIYTWVSTNIDNDYAYYSENQEKRAKLQRDTAALAEWNEALRPRVFKKLLKEQKTICTGYAYLIRELATMADIRCKIIDGYGRTAVANIGGDSIPNHSWNAVQLDDQWYLCDATWSSGYFEVQGDQHQFVKAYNEGYFLPDPALFAKNHYPLDTTWMLMATKPSLHEFLHAPLVYGGAFKHHLIPVAPDSMRLQLIKDEPIILSLTAPDTVKMHDIHLVFSNSAKDRIVKPTVARSKQGLVRLRYTPKKLGYFDMHVKMGSDYIATYTAKVKRKRK